MSTASVGTTSGSPINISGLASGLDTSSIISALLAVEKLPITHLTSQQEKLAGPAEHPAESCRPTCSSSASPSPNSAAPRCSKPRRSPTPANRQRIGATVTAGAGVGGYQLEVTQLANSAQRSYAFASPTAEDTITIEGHEYKLKEGATAAELAGKINADGKGGVYAAVTNSETIVLSSRTSGASGR